MQSGWCHSEHEAAYYTCISFVHLLCHSFVKFLMAGDLSSEVSQDMSQSYEDSWVALPHGFLLIFKNKMLLLLCVQLVYLRPVFM